MTPEPGSPSAAKERAWWPVGFRVVLAAYAVGAAIGVFVGLALRGAL